MKNIATDIFTFEELRRKNCLYVDKTRFIWDIVSGGSSIFFLSRPRRFGKSLLLSTFKAYFEGKRELFEGLEIERLKTDEWETYPVIHLDLAKGSSRISYDALICNWKQQLLNSFLTFELEPVGENPALMLENLINAVNKKYGKQVVILIDEYDKPILDSMFEPYVSDVMKVMSDFYQKLKSANDIERFVFITGVTKFAHVSLFSGSNNPTDLTRNKTYATMLGYTEKELRENFAEYIDKTADELEMDKDVMMSNIKQWYNGTRFVRDTESVYNPVSVGKLFVNRSFDNYWITTGTPRILIEKVKNSPFRLHDVASEWRRDMATSKYEIEKTTVEELAIQTGYLSIAEWRKETDITWEVRYDFPNKEIRDAWYTNIITMVGNFENEFCFDPLIVKMNRALNKPDLNEFMEIVTNFFSGIPYENAGEITEGYFRNQLHTLFTLFGIPNQCEVQQASQRVDIVAQTRKMAVVFELKMLPKEKAETISKMEDKAKAKKSMTSAITSMMAKAAKQAKENGYADKYRDESEIVKTVAVVFDEKTRKLLRWKEVG